MANQVDFYQVSLKLLLKNKNGEVLLLKCPSTDGSYANYYDMVGGRIDVNEFTTDFADIIDREVKEEIGNVQYKFKMNPVAIGRHLVDVDTARTKKGTHVIYIFFEADYLEGDIKISDEHDGVLWADLNKIDLEKHLTSGILEGIQMYLKDKSRAAH